MNLYVITVTLRIYIVRTAIVMSAIVFLFFFYFRIVVNKMNWFILICIYIQCSYVCCIWTPTNNVYNTSCTTMATMCTVYCVYVNSEKKLSFQIDLSVKNTHNLDHNSFSNEIFYSN